MGSISTKEFRYLSRLTLLGMKDLEILTIFDTFIRSRFQIKRSPYVLWLEFVNCNLCCHDEDTAFYYTTCFNR